MNRILEVTNNLVINRKTRGWCKLPYPGHLHGCPNFNKKSTCPPKIPFITNVFNLEKSHWFSIVSFDLKSHKEKMKKKHPDWSERQCACCLYWQGTVRKQLKEVSEAFLKDDLIYSDCPEAMGINVFETMEKFSIKLERNPQEIVYKIALIGYPQKEKL